MAINFQDLRCQRVASKWYMLGYLKDYVQIHRFLNVHRLLFCDYFQSVDYLISWTFTPISIQNERNLNRLKILYIITQLCGNYILNIILGYLCVCYFYTYFFFKHVLLYLSLLINSAKWLFSAKYCTDNLNVITQNIVVVLIFIILFFSSATRKKLRATCLIRLHYYAMYYCPQVINIKAIYNLRTQ